MQKGATQPGCALLLSLTCLLLTRGGAVVGLPNSITRRHRLILICPGAGGVRAWGGLPGPGAGHSRLALAGLGSRGATGGRTSRGICAFPSGPSRGPGSGLPRGRGPTPHSGTGVSRSGTGVSRAGHCGIARRRGIGGRRAGSSARHRGVRAGSVRATALGGTGLRAGPCGAAVVVPSIPIAAGQDGRAKGSYDPWSCSHTVPLRCVAECARLA
jgi:hypothetical protein